MQLVATRRVRATTCKHTSNEDSRAELGISAGFACHCEQFHAAALDRNLINQLQTAERHQDEGEYAVDDLIHDISRGESCAHRSIRGWRLSRSKCTKAVGKETVISVR